MILAFSRPAAVGRNTRVAAGLFALALIFPATGLRAQEKPAPPGSNRADAPAKPPADVDLAKLDSAEKLWGRVGELKRKIDSEEEVPEAEELRDIRALEAACVEFGRRYPQDPRRHEARLLRLQIASALANVDHIRTGPSEAEMLGALREIGAAADTPGPIRADALFSLLAVDAMMIERRVPDAPGPDAVDARAADFERLFPGDSRRERIRLIRAQLLAVKDPAAATTRLTELAASPDPEVAEGAASELALVGVRERGLDLKFTAVDGREFDLAKWRGKVVLVDFWATWCAPCIAKLPEIKAVYDKFHGRGFEVVGISLDVSKEDLLRFAAQRELPWPQYFDGKHFQNEISSRYRIQAIPRKWLVDKAGKVADFDAGEGLEAAVERLLAAP